jgi:hypothetical protein
MSIAFDLSGLSSYKDECFDASRALDERRQGHEQRFKRWKLQLRPTTRAEMIDYVEDWGPTEAVHHDDLRHVPVAPVAGGIAFAPRRMTLDVLVEVYEHLHKVRRPSGRVYDRVAALLNVYQGGLREKDLIALSGVSRAGVRKSLAALAFDGKLRIEEEPTRPGGTPRKRYFPVLADPFDVSLDPSLAAGVL